MVYLDSPFKKVNNFPKFQVNDCEEKKMEKDYKCR